MTAKECQMYVDIDQEQSKLFKEIRRAGRRLNLLLVDSPEFNRLAEQVDILWMIILHNNKAMVKSPWIYQSYRDNFKEATNLMTEIKRTIRNRENGKFTHIKCILNA